MGSWMSHASNFMYRRAPRVDLLLGLPLHWAPGFGGRSRLHIIFVYLFLFWNTSRWLGLNFLNDVLQISFRLCYRGNEPTFASGFVTCGWLSLLHFPFLPTSPSRFAPESVYQVGIPLLRSHLDFVRSTLSTRT
jgi:hypothetical protein